MATVFVLITIVPGTIETTLDFLTKIGGVVRALPVTGPYDIIVEVEASTIANALNIVKRNIHQLEGITSTETLVVTPW
jgi:DNA-binding Lrp family transcriptional regulator